MTDILLDIGVKGVDQLKAAADELVRNGRVSKELAKDYNTLGANTLKVVKIKNELLATERRLNKAYGAGRINLTEYSAAIEEANRKAKEKILVDERQVKLAKQRQAALDKENNRISQLTATYRKDILAKKAYLQAQRDIREAGRRNIITQQQMQDELRRTATEFAEFNRGLATGGNQFAKFNVEAYKANQRVKRFASVGMQQAGYQVGDFIVQVQSGTDALVAFGQQGSQLAGIFGPVGAIVGALIAAGTSIAMVFKQMKEAAEGTVENIQQAFNKLPEFFKTLSYSISDPFDDAFIRIEERYGSLLKNIAKQQLKAMRTAATGLIDPAAELVSPGLMSKLKVTFTPFLTKEERAERFKSLSLEEKAILKIQERIREQVNVAKNLNQVLGAVQDAHANIAVVSEKAADAFAAQAEEAGLVALIQEKQDNERAERLKKENGIFLLQNKVRLNIIADISAAENKFLEERAKFNSRTAQNEAAAANKLRVVQEKANAAALAFIKRKRNESILALGEEADQLISNANQALDLDEKVAAEKRANAIETANFNFSLVEGLLGTLQKEQEELNKSAEKLGERLGIGYAKALEIIRAAQAEATVGLDAFGGPGDFRYSVPTTFSPDKDGKSGRTLKNIQDTIDALREQTDQETKLLGLTGKRRKEEEVFYDLVKANKDADIKLSEQKLRAISKEIAAQQQANEMYEKAIEFVGGIEGAFSDFIAGGLKDFKSFVGSIKDMFVRLLADLVAQAAANRILIPIATGFMGSFGNAAAGATTANLVAGGGMAGSLAAGASSFGAGLQASLGMGGFTSAGVFNVGANAAVATAATGVGASATMATLGAAVPLIAAGVALFSLFGKKKKPAISPENMNKVVQALKMTGQELDGTGREAQKAAAALGKVAGGFDKLTKKAQAYFENFYTEGERRAIAASEATEALNKTFAELEMAVPKTHSEFRQLVEAQDLMTKEGREVYNTLLDVSGAFVTLKGTADQANQAIKLGRAREREQLARSAPIFTERFISEEMVNQQIETLGTTAELNEHLLRGLDNYLSIQNIPASARREQLDKVKEQFDGFLEDTTYVQNIQREFYEGIRKPIQEVTNMLRKVGASKQERTQYELYGDLSIDLMNKMTDRFGKYFEYNVLPYTTQLELFIKEQVSQVIGPLVEAIRTTNFRGDLGVLNQKIKVSADRVVAGYQALASGYRKIVEAVDKVEDYYEKDFAALRAEYSGASGLESSTAVKSIADRISSIIELPKQLVAVIERSMDTLSKQADKLDGAFTKVQQEYFKVKYSGLQVSEGLQKSYRDMLANRQAAAKAA